MRILLYGMQSSGATLLTYLLGQRKKSIVVTDLWSTHRMPKISCKKDISSVIGKAVITEEYNYRDHRVSFKPDVEILVLRHPVHNYVSLSRREYKRKGEKISKKFEKLERLYAERKNTFDLMLHYEDIFYDKSGFAKKIERKGICFEEGYFNLQRKPEEIKRFNFENSNWLKENYKSKWAFGNIRDMDKIDKKYAFKFANREHIKKASSYCPRVTNHMKKYYRKKIPKKILFGTQYAKT